MVEEDNILKMVLEKESWEEVLYQIVSLENIDPWNVDIIKLTEGFIKFVREAENLDFRIPAKIVFVATILLKLKSEYLTILEEKTSVEEELEKEKEFIDLGIDPDLVKLGVPIKRVPKRQVTLDELVGALKNALEVREKKVERVQKIRSRLKRELAVEEDITKRIEKVMDQIEDRMKASDEGKLNFKDIVEDWKRDTIVEHFIPVLHLENNQKITTEQREFFKEILISKRTTSEAE